MISHDILGRLIDGEGRNGRLSIDSRQKDPKISPAQEGELSSQTRTHTNVVHGGVGVKYELHYNKHVI